MCPGPIENGTNGINGQNGHDDQSSQQRPETMPYQVVGDFLSNTSNFKIIESTLREGEQFANAFFDTETKIKIYLQSQIEGQNPNSLVFRKHIPAFTYQSDVRCNMEDARLAVESGVDGVDVVIGTQNVEVRFSSEDSFRSDFVDLLSLYKAVDQCGVNRVGVADTIGCATPRQVYDLIRTLRGVVHCDIETHFHNDTGCAIANAHAALEAGATHVDTSVLGIGERNGITSLGGLLARMIVSSHDYVTSRYKLHKLKEIEDMVAEAVQINVPFNNPITGFCSFTHKAGIHAKAILNEPSTYEIINPADFGMSRYIHFTSRLTGWNAIKSRVEQLGLKMTDDQIKTL
ncbi:MAG: hypothetical protein Q9227_000195 [Pyrenula ochraceoflavens]